MPEYSKEEWNRLIEQYRRQFTSQYTHAQQTHNIESAASEPAVEATETVAEEHASDDIGSLQVRVSTLNNALPIENATVVVSRDKGIGQHELVRVMKTDSSGTTETIDLPTQSRALSLSPANPNPYDTYTIEVSADGYFRNRYENVPIYGGITAVQNAVMIPLPEGGDNDITLTYGLGGERHG